MKLFEDEKSDNMRKLELKIVLLFGRVKKQKRLVNGRQE